MSSLPHPPVLFGALLRSNREAANLTQSELADRLSVSLRSVQAWEAGTIPQPRHRRALAAYFASGNGEVAA